MLLKNKLIGYRLLLASKSPRRRQLLHDCGLDFEVVDGREAEEIFPDDMVAEKVAEYLSGLKSEAWADTLTEGDVLITADTVVILDGAVLGKPADRNEARQMLGRLSGARHTVITGVTLRSATTSHTFSARSNVWFRTLTEEEIDSIL